jgi:cation:H+ antiporter
MTYLLFLIGFVLLIKGADWLVEGSSAIAKRYGVSALVIGLTIVAFGTSTPELVVNLLASLEGTTDIAIGNVLGSNIANILLILGISALIYPLKVQLSTIWKEIPFALLAILIVGVIANDMWLNQTTENVISRGDGLVLMGFFAIFLYYIVSIARSGGGEMEGEDIPTLSTGASAMRIIAGLGGLVVGGSWIVNGAITIANQFGVSEALIGLTIVAVGTSLPELATSAMAAYRRQSDIAVGNIVGSNIFNIFWILGLSATISPLPFNVAQNTDVAMTIAATFLLFLSFYIGKKHHLERWQGGVFVGIYILYVVYLILRG